MATQILTPSATTIAGFGAGEIIYFTGGGYNVTATVDQSGQTQASICEVMSDFTGDIGTAAAPFQQSFSTRLVYAAISGTMYWESDASDVDTTALVYVIGGGHLVAQTTGTITRAECASGTFTINSAVVATTARNAGGTLNLYDAGGATAVTTLEQAVRGTTYCQRPVTTANVMGGTLMLDSDDADATNAHGTLNVYGGTLDLRDVGTITRLTWMDGNVRFPSRRPVTITDCDINMTLPGAQAFLDNPLITFSNTPQRRFTDGRPLN